MRYMLDGIFERAGVIRNMKIDQKRLLTDRIANTENQLMLVTREMKLKIHNMVEEVEQKVSKALNEEIWRLGVLVDEFNMPFHTEPLVLNVYKKEINSHVELGLGSNLRARLSTALAMNVETAQREMTGTFFFTRECGSADCLLAFLLSSMCLRIAIANFADKINRIHPLFHRQRLFTDKSSCCPCVCLYCVLC